MTASGDGTAGSEAAASTRRAYAGRPRGWISIELNLPETAEGRLKARPAEAEGMLDGFLWRWSETITWCAGRADRRDPVGSLRSPLIQPGLLRERISAVFDVQDARSELLKEQKLKQPTDELENGRLLIYFPDLNLGREGPRIATGDFFDRNAVPPWDTWVSYDEDGEFLIAWIPLEFVDLAGRGIEMDQDASIDWLARRGVPLNYSLKERGLLR